MSPDEVRALALVRGWASANRRLRERGALPGDIVHALAIAVECSDQRGDESLAGDWRTTRPDLDGDDVTCLGTLRALKVPEEVTVAGATFSGEVAARRCGECGEVYIAADDAMRFDLRVARELGKRGVATGELKAQQEPRGVEGLTLAVGAG